MNLEHDIVVFLKSINEETIYNESSLQFELGIYFKEKGYKVKFERNVTHFNIDKASVYKKEIDLVIYNQDESNEACAIELKQPRNGQVPETMYSFLTDVAFVEQLQASKDFNFVKTYALLLTNDKNFWQGRSNDSDIYQYFRTGISIPKEVYKPTGKGKGKEAVEFKNSYEISWKKVSESSEYQYVLIEIPFPTSK